MLLHDGFAASVNCFRQALSFGGVGIFATITHVAVVWVLISAAGCDPYLSNLLGTCTAFAVSFLGNASLTFRTNRSLQSSAGRYLFVSLISFCMTSIILAFVESNSWPIYIYAIIVITTVPAATFFLAKLWAFKPVSSFSDPKFYDQIFCNFDANYYRGVHKFPVYI